MVGLRLGRAVGAGGCTVIKAPKPGKGIRMHARSAIAPVLVAFVSLALSGGLCAAAVRDVTDPATEAFTADLRKVALGVSIPDGRDLGQLDDFRASIGGQRVATWTIWSRWGDPGRNAFPMEAARGARARGAVPVIWWVPTPGEQYASHQNIIDGVHDEYIRAFAREARRYEHTLLLRFAHQANSDYLPWAWDYSETDGNTRGTFKRAWRYVHRIFRDVGARNVKFVWTVATQTCAGDGLEVSADVTNCLARPLGYPGHRWVDYTGFTWENWAEASPDSTVQSEPWITMLKGFRPIVRRLSAVSGKPILAVAIASAPDGGNRAKWIRRGYRGVYRHLPRIKAIMYLNVDLLGLGHRDWSLSGRSLEAYADIAATPRFQGRIR